VERARGGGGVGEGIWLKKEGFRPTRVGGEGRGPKEVVARGAACRACVVGMG